MNVNTLSAIANIISNPISELRSFYEGRNRINNMGAALETYVMDLFAGTLNESDEQKRNRRYSQTFSYTGNQNNPPDMVIHKGDAIEVKKIENPSASLALNSSYPKAKLLVTDTKINDNCRTCEDWSEKDILYAIGVAKGRCLTKLFFVYGVDYAASASVYERISKVIKDGIHEIPDLELANTQELGRVNRVDPLGITYLRIRGMWGIENPVKVFSYVYTPPNKEFEFAAIINTEKYESFPVVDREKLEAVTDTNFKITDVEIKNPNNPAKLKHAKLITFNR